MEARSRAREFFLGPNYNTPIQEMPPENVPVQVECSIMRNVTASSTEAELGGLFENFQKATYIRMALAEMGHLQPPTSASTENTAANSKVKGMTKKKRISSNRHEILLGQRQNPTKPFPHIMGRGK